MRFAVEGHINIKPMASTQVRYRNQPKRMRKMTLDFSSLIDPSMTARDSDKISVGLEGLLAAYS